MAQFLINVPDEDVTRLADAADIIGKAIIDYTPFTNIGVLPYNPLGTVEKPDDWHPDYDGSKEFYAGRN